MALEVSAPGKIHLIGEHSVCYGFPAIISAIEKRIKIKAEKSENIKIKNNFYQKETEFDIENALLAAKESVKLWKEGDKKNDFSELFSFLKSDFWKKNQAMLGLILNQLKINPMVKQGVSLTIDGNLPIGAGLGSSASFSVAFSKAIAEIYGLKISPQKINALAFELEKFNHSRPSGGDNSACAFGGTIWFEKGKIESLFLPDFLQNLIIVLFPRKNLSTGDLVQKVGNLKPNFRNSIMKNIAKVTYEMKRVLENKNLEEVKNLINFAQDNLAELGISNPEIQDLVKEIRKIGGAAKISGGGAGTLICFHQNKKQMVSLLKKLKLNFEEIKLGAEGVKIEKK